jgi:hypothetical protein
LAPACPRVQPDSWLAPALSPAPHPLQVIYSFALSSVFLHQTIGPTSAAGVLLTLVGVALVVLRHGPKPSAAEPPPPPKPPSLAEQVLLKQASAAEARLPALQPQQEAGDASGGAQPAPGRALSAQRSLRALASFRRASAELMGEGGAVAAAVSAPLKLLQQLSVAASAQLDRAPSLSAADLAVAAEGACSASTAALVASAAAYEAFGGGGTSGGRLPAAGGASATAGEGSWGAGAEGAAGSARAAVAAAFAGDDALGSAGGGDGASAGDLIPAAVCPPAGAAAAPGAAPVAAPGGSGPVDGPPGGPDPTPPPLAPRMSSHLSGCLDGSG